MGLGRAGRPSMTMLPSMDRVGKSTEKVVSCRRSTTCCSSLPAMREGSVRLGRPLKSRVVPYCPLGISAVKPGSPPSWCEVTVDEVSPGRV